VAERNDANVRRSSSGQKYTITEPASDETPAKDTPPPPATQFKDISDAANFAFAMPPESSRETKTQGLQPMDTKRVGPYMAMGDVDGSGRDAVIISGGSSESVRIFHVDRAGKLTAPEVLETATGAAPANGPLLVFDADGDGANDLLVTTAGTSYPAGSPLYQPRLFLNDGHGTFRLAASDAIPPLTSSVGAVAAADFNRDGLLDVFIGARVLPGNIPWPHAVRCS